jgi:peroxiredoxin
MNTMHIKFHTLLLIIFSYSASLIGQEKDPRGFYLVEAEEFTPPVKDMIASFEGHVAEGFLAPDIYGEEQYLYDFRGKPTILFFFNLETEEGRNLMEELKVLYKKNGGAMHMIGMAKNNKEDLLAYFGEDKTVFPIIYNGEVFGQMAYGADLGSPRVFVIDDQGIIKRVMPATMFQLEKNITGLFDECVSQFGK